MKPMACSFVVLIKFFEIVDFAGRNIVAQKYDAQ